MIKLRRLKIVKYRNVKPGTELHFDDQFNLILGQNGSGKTTLLALISAVCRGDFSELKNEEYDLEADTVLNGVTASLQVHHRRVHPSPGAGPPTGTTWDDGFVVASDPPQRSPPIPVGWWRPHPDKRLSGINFNVSPSLSDTYRFDESLGAFAAATGRAPELAAPATPPPASYEQEDLGEDGVVGTYAYTASSIHDLLRTHDHAAPIFHRRLEAADLELCRDLAEALGVTNCTIEPNYKERRIRADDLQFKFQGFAFEITRPDGTIIHHDRLSYGQKRLLAFFYYLACNPAVVIADELVNGLHHRWIETCMNAIGGRQAFLTSQNPLLFDHVEFESVEQVRARFITCILEQVDGREQMVWANMSEADATRFFEAYQAGIEHVGDILITRGMW